MKTITIIRHEQCKNDIEEEQLNFSDKVFDVIIVPPTSTAIQTYEKLNIKANNLIYTDLFKEYIEHDLSEILENDKIIHEMDVRKRAQKAFQFLKGTNFNNIAIVTHLSFSWYLLEQFGKPITSLENTKTITFSI